MLLTLKLKTEADCKSARKEAGTAKGGDAMEMGLEMSCLCPADPQHPTLGQNSVKYRVF